MQKTDNVLYSIKILYLLQLAFSMLFLVNSSPLLKMKKTIVWVELPKKTKECTNL